MKLTKYYLIYKPFQVMCQFSPEGEKKTLKDFFQVPNDVYPVGRLDYDSEGLLLLTNDKAINNKLLNPTFQHEREYWVQVDGAIDENAIRLLEKGVDISINGKTHHTLPAKAQFLSEKITIPERNPPIRFRKEIPAPWISLTLKEGKNRQVRKMTAALGFPTLRLVRYRIEKLILDGLQPGEMKELNRAEVCGGLFGRR
ncbi:MAG: pseudouridine synthase [Pseudopedobacter saltans]|uniref:Pseudouridine synthase n=1 Tax=Pseudopedobacter saltans TaxID=151895 RepID=A0A2W5FBP9_9SPHI|nr:MAG: pseudouridine synthase [Pseudopedobacter saltans]